MEYFALRLSFLFFLLIAGTNGFDLNCTFGVKHLPHWWYMGETMTCEVPAFSIAKDSDETVTSINNSTEPHSEVYGIIIGYQKANFFPRGIEKLLPNLKGIRIHSIKLPSIKQSDLKPFPNLIELALDYNDIVILPDNLFAFNPKLKRIDFMYNKKLKAVGQNVFPIGLEVANFEGTRCIRRGARSEDDMISLLERIQKLCYTPESLRKLLFGDEFDALDRRVLELKDELHQSEDKIDALEQVIKDLTLEVSTGNFGEIDAPEKRKSLIEI